MKFVRTVIVFDRGGLADGKQWAEMHKAYVAALTGIVHPPGNNKFVIRRKAKKRTAAGALSKQWMRNGVGPIRAQFLANLANVDNPCWRSESPVDSERRLLAEAQAREGAEISFREYPGKRCFHLNDDDWGDVFHDKVGDFDFFAKLSGGVRCVIEWETGNVSSSHRSMNKLCLVMQAGLIDIGVVILPSRLLYTHLTDRIGNWQELSPYLPVWHRLGQRIKRGLLAVTVVEQDEVTDNLKVPYIKQGTDGRSRRKRG